MKFRLLPKDEKEARKNIWLIIAMIACSRIAAAAIIIAFWDTPEFQEIINVYAIAGFVAIAIALIAFAIMRSLLTACTLSAILLLDALNLNTNAFYGNESAQLNTSLFDIVCSYLAISNTYLLRKWKREQTDNA